MQSRMVFRYCSWSENRGTKLNFTKAFKNPKKFALIYGNELKSLVISGKEDVNIISISLVKN
jgi:hypothetical protein